MKRFYKLIFTLGVLAFSIIACEDDEASKLHEWTEEELAFRDSVEAARAGVDADYIFTYDLTLPLDTVNYTGATVEVDTDILMEEFGYSTIEDLTAGFGTVGTSQADNEISFYAINGSTGNDYLGDFTANGLGHWFDRNGDVVTWGETAYLFSEFDWEESFSFNVGQYPGRMTVGETYRFIQMMEKDDYVVAFVFNVTAGAIGEEEEEEEQIGDVTVVATYNLAVADTVRGDYSPTLLSFSFETAAADLGTTPEDLGANPLLYAINSDGSLITEYTANTGYWFANTGDVTGWGAEGCALFVEYGGNGIFNVGQFPEATAPGDAYSVAIGLVYEDQMVVYNLTYHIVEVVATYDLSVSAPVNSDYQTVQLTFDLETAASDLGTTADAFTADPVLYALNPDGGFVVNYTANLGFWYDSNGAATNWGTADCSFFIEYSTETAGVLNVGQFPEVTTSGDVFTTSLGLVSEGKVMLYNITFTIE